jgi:glycosyltransferase involved in cell wall biosynthesis
MNYMDEPLVSIIIPVYDAQCFLERCLVSCRQQTYRTIEIIMVDDGSTDHSAELCIKYAHSDSRFIFISQENGGVSHARNTGIRKAKGKYILFADSDDWLKSDAVFRYVERAENDGTDLVVAGFNRIINTTKIPMADIDADMVMAREDFAAYMADSPADFYYGVVWNKLYRADIVRSHHLYFSRHFKWCEDFLFNLDYLQYTETVSTIKMPLYYYVKRTGSICESQLTYAKTLSLKYELLGYYRNLYKSINLYKSNKLKINGFLFAYAHDGGESEYRKLKAGQVAVHAASGRRKIPGNKSDGVQLKMPVFSLLKKKAEKQKTFLHTAKNYEMRPEL